MTTIAWSPQVPLRVLREGYEIREAPSVAVAPVDDGAPRARRVGSADLRRQSWRLLLTVTQRAAFAEWFRRSLAGGVLPFARPDPLSQQETRYRFADPAGSPPVYAPRGALWVVSLDLWELVA